MRSFWFGKDLPAEFSDTIVRDQLSFNGQIHFRCPSCDEVTWVDITYAKTFIKSGSDFSCPNCKHLGFDVVKFMAIESRLCTACASQSFASPEDDFECSVCHARKFAVDDTITHPTYPSRLFALYGSEKPIGHSVNDDIEFLMEYIHALRMSPQFHLTCIHLIAFIESIFKHVYRSSEDAINLLNVASGLMRTVYRESGDPDAAYLSIAIMSEARDLTVDLAQRAVFGFNINQNVYSVLARRDDKVLSLRFDFDLKEYGIWLSRRTLAAFEETDEDQLAQLRAQQKWLLGDILKASSPSEAQIDEALSWFGAALQDPALPKEMVDYVQESALAAKAKRQILPPQERQELETNLTQLAERYLDQSDGLQRIQSLLDLLRAESRLGQSQRRRDLALRCLGEAIIYTAVNDPRNMLRHAGTILSRLVAGFAAERFDAGSPLEGIAGVEAFRSLAIDQGNVSTTLGHHVHDLEVQLMTKRLVQGATEDPVVVAKTMLSQYEESLERNIRDVLEAEAGRLIVWFEVWEGIILTATIKRHDNELAVQAEANEYLLADIDKALNVPMADAPPGRLRARQVETALASGWELFKSRFESEPIDHASVLVGPSALGSWPVDVAETVQSAKVDSVRPMIFAPTISVASAAHRSAKGRSIANVLLLSYGGDDLTGTLQEIKDIKAAYGSCVTILDGEAVSKAEVLDALSGVYEVIHFCGHGEFDYLEPMQSKIYFHNDKGADGVITATDILSCGSTGHHPIVVLSACTSALVLPNGSNNFLGLAGALIRTGATSIVGARWPISDAICAAFSKHFHARLVSGHSVAEAVSFAKNLLRDARLDEWSAFMCIGG